MQPLSVIPRHAKPATLRLVELSKTTQETI
jgi:hypothetical protein